MEIKKDDGKRVYLMKYTNLMPYDWDSYINKNVVVELIGQQANETTGKTQYVFSVYVENELEYPKVDNFSFLF